MKYLKVLFSVFSLIPGYFKPPSAIRLFRRRFTADFSPFNLSA
ncbi:MAG: hypothetical protein ACK5L7_05160 [Paludibacteraceae bacterium]